MKIVSNTILPSSEMEAIKTSKRTKMNLSLQQSYESIEVYTENRNDVNLQQQEEDTVDERDYSITSLSYDDETTTTTGTDAVEGCGLFNSNRFNNDDESHDKSHRSHESRSNTVISHYSDMVNDIEQELHERFFASHSNESESDSSMDTNDDDTTLNKSHSDDTLNKSHSDDGQDDTVDDGQDDTVEDEDEQEDATIDSMPSTSSTTVSSKMSTRSKTSTTSWFGKLFGSGGASVQSTIVEEEQYVQEEEAAKSVEEKDVLAPVEEGTKRTASIIEEEKSVQEEEVKSVEQVEEEELPVEPVEKTEDSQTKSGSWFGELFSSTTASPAASVVEEESVKEEAIKSIEEVEQPIQDEEQLGSSVSAKDILSRVQEVLILDLLDGFASKVLDLPLAIIDEEKSNSVQEDTTTVIQKDQEPDTVENTPVVKDIFAVESSSYSIDSFDNTKAKERKSRSSSTLLETKSLEPEDCALVLDVKVTKKKKSWRKKIRYVFHTKKT